MTVGNDKSRTVLFALGIFAVFLFAFWRFHDYRRPLAAQARELNRGRLWQPRSRVDSKGVAQVWVSPGCFEMGSDPFDDHSSRPDETPRHTVCISAGFWMDQYEVTNESFRQFADSGGFEDRKYWSDDGWRAYEGLREPYRLVRGYEGATQPRGKTSWYEAEAYAAWRGGRLPTEAQWEWAARGPDSKRYP